LLSGDKEAGKVVSGKVKMKDKLVIGTEQFFKMVAEGNLRSGLEQGEVNEVMEGLAAIVHGHDKNSKASALVVEVKGEEKAEKLPDGPLEVEELSDEDKKGRKRSKVNFKGMMGQMVRGVKGLLSKLQPKTVRVKT